VVYTPDLVMQWSAEGFKVGSKCHKYIRIWTKATCQFLSGLMSFLSHSACCAWLANDYNGLGSNPGQGVSFQLVGLMVGMLKLNYWTGTDGLPVSSLNCERPLHSVMSAGCQITDRY